MTTPGCAELVRETDWAATPIGPRSRWPQSLATIVEVMLHSRHPMFLWWGPELVQIYNDAYVPSFGVGKHPRAMGQRGADCWQEIWPIIAPQIDDVMTRAKSSWNEDQLVPIFRNGRIEDVFWTYGYSPVFLESGAVGGTLVVCTETTTRVLSERRLRILRELAERTSAVVEPGDVLRVAHDVVARARVDVPFALFFGPDDASGAAELVSCVGLDAADTAAAAASVQTIRAARGREGAVPHAPIVVELADAAAFLIDLAEPQTGRVWGSIAFGLSARLPFDTAYREFLLQLGDHLVAAQSRIEAFRIRAAAESERRNLLEKAHREREVLLADLESASRAKDEFLAMLGHELRNPLSPIVTALQLMRMREGGMRSKEEQIIERQVTHLVRLVDDLLDVSKITRGKVELKKETIDLADVVAEAVEMASVLFEQRRHELVIDVPRSGLRWHGDPVRIAQALANLLTNAARYTDPNGRIVITAAQDGDEIVIRVRDNGIGIAGDMLPRVFDMFAQVNRSSQRAEGGLGLGLTLVKSLVALHGGTVAAYSDGLGRGSEFVIRLPVAIDDAHRTEPSALRRPTPPIRSRRVLVVDDNVDAADLLGETLRLHGHDVSIAHDPLIAIERLTHFDAEVAILDIGMPVMDGYELATRVRESIPRCRLVALTGYGQDHDVARSGRAGFERHFVKPVDIGALLELVGR